GGGPAVPGRVAGRPGAVAVRRAGAGPAGCPVAAARRRVAPTRPGRDPGVRFLAPGRARAAPRPRPSPRCAGRAARTGSAAGRAVGQDRSPEPLRALAGPADQPRPAGTLGRSVRAADRRRAGRVRRAGPTALAPVTGATPPARRPARGSRDGRRADGIMGAMAVPAQGDAPGHEATTRSRARVIVVRAMNRRGIRLLHLADLVGVYAMLLVITAAMTVVRPNFKAL